MNNISDNIIACQTGYDLSLFMNKLKARQYQCGICNHICRTTVTYQCNQCQNIRKSNLDHIYCKLCLNQLLNHTNFQCPINPNHGKVSLIMDEYNHHMVNHLMIYCPTNHYSLTNQYCCRWKGEVQEMFNHLQNCQYRNGMEICNMSRYGCGFYGDLEALTHHNQTSANCHTYLMCYEIDIMYKVNTTLSQQIRNFQKYVDQLKEKNFELRQENKKLAMRLKLSNSALNLKIKVHQHFQQENKQNNNDINCKSNLNPPIPAFIPCALEQEIYEKLSRKIQLYSRPESLDRIKKLLLRKDNNELLLLLENPQMLQREIQTMAIDLEVTDLK